MNMLRVSIVACAIALMSSFSGYAEDITPVAQELNLAQNDTISQDDQIQDISAADAIIESSPAQEKVTVKTAPKVSIGALKIENAISDALVYISQLHELFDNDDIKAVLLIINSGGGGAGASWSFFEEVKKLRMKKPIVAFIPGDCASGAYLIASAAHYIVASPGSGIGSIGVRWSYHKLRNQRMQQENVVADIEEVVFTRGKYKILPKDDKLVSMDEHQVIGCLLDALYNQFVHDIAQMRGLSIENQAQWAEGRVFPASVARDLGLIDELGSYSAVLEALRMLLSKRGNEQLGMFELIYPQSHEEDEHKCSCSCSQGDWPHVELRY